ncbi:sensor domain-containing diguanylate cyclase [Sedimenticola sp.]|uniref:sensor domain-containing diguanylate cyclase n=1 Tax=Sedimenticola sp. TaxID=1940285 RepID=UPI003D1422E3
MTEQTPSKKLLIALIDHLQDAVFAIEAGRFVFINKQMSALYGFTEQEMLHHPVTEFIFHEDREMVMQRYRARQQGEQITNEYRFRIVTKLGEIRSVCMRVGIIRGEDGIVSTVGSLHDITDQIHTMSALATSQADIESILNNMPDVFYRTDMTGTITLISPSCQSVIGYAPEEMLGENMSRFYCDQADRERVVQAIKAGGGKARQVEACMRHKDGSPMWISTNAYIRVDANGQPIGVEGIARDITDKKRNEERLAELGRIDHLTGLLNRRSFLEEGEKLLQIAQRYERNLSVMMIDLDRFKSVNDRYGHQAGDLALIYFADACRDVFRKTEIIGRMGGEEFAVIVPETGLEASREMVNRLGRRLKEQPFQFEGQTIVITLSVGLVTLSAHEQSLELLLNHADRLLYQAKHEGRDRVILADAID